MDSRPKSVEAPAVDDARMTITLPCGVEEESYPYSIYRAQALHAPPIQPYPQLSQSSMEAPAADDFRQALPRGVKEESHPTRRSPYAGPSQRYPPTSQSVEASAVDDARNTLPPGVKEESAHHEEHRALLSYPLPRPPLPPPHQTLSNCGRRRKPLAPPTSRRKPGAERVKNFIGGINSDIKSLHTTTKK